MRLLKLLGLAVGVLGAIALVVVLGQVARAQTRERPFELRHLIIGGSALGVTVRDVDSADVTREKLAAPTGAAVENVESGGPAEKAGVKAGDVFLTFDGEKVRSARHFSRLVEETPEGREVTATVMRNGEEVQLALAPQPQRLWSSGSLSQFRDFRMPQRFEMTMPDLREHLELRNRGNNRDLFTLLDSRGRLGVGVQELTDQLGEFFGAPNGVLVTEVEEGTPAKTAGLKAGDVITKINDQVVGSPEELRRRLASVTGDVRVTIVRDRKEQTITAKLDELERREPRRVVRS